MNKQEFFEELKKLGINLTNDQIDKLARFYQLLVTWNEKINLTTIIKEEEVYLKHFYDSLTLIKVIDLRQPLTILDVGTGIELHGRMQSREYTKVLDDGSSIEKIAYELSVSYAKEWSGSNEWSNE